MDLAQSRPGGDETVNFDGQWTRRVIERLGFGTAQGSSSRGAIEGLSVMARDLKEGRHVAFTIDGPRGPRYVAKPGTGDSGAPHRQAPSPCFHIGLSALTHSRNPGISSRFRIPFSRAVMFFAPLVRVPADAGSEILSQKQAEMQAALEKVRDVAESWFQFE